MSQATTGTSTTAAATRDLCLDGRSTRILDDSIRNQIIIAMAAVNELQCHHVGIDCRAGIVFQEKRVPVLLGVIRCTAQLVVTGRLNILGQDHAY